jgi:hypothetical protein
VERGERGVVPLMVLMIPLSFVNRAMGRPLVQCDGWDWIELVKYDRFESANKDTLLTFCDCRCPVNVQSHAMISDISTNPFALWFE